MASRTLSLLGGLVAQFVFIAAGVYLGMQADAYKEEKAHREAARSALENFRAELASNRDRLAEYAPVYAAYGDSMRLSQKRGDPMPKTIREVFQRLGWRGLNPASFQHTAWDLALATQSLSYLPRSLAFRIARVYGAQQRMEDQQRALSNTLFSPVSLDDARVFPFLMTFGGYIEDSLIMTKQITAAYDRMIPAVDSALNAMPK